ncbi:MAG TPA: hypothetical protein VNQ56_16740 [Pseudolabrys sp.]|nr:hypothetical protein [Pseudolabrys sp.]
MSPIEKTEFRAALWNAFATAIEAIGVDAFKRTSFFGSNDPACKAAKLAENLKKAA